MARIRTIKPEFWTDETLTECSVSARLLFIGTWNFADDSGNMEHSAKQLKMKIFPGDDLKVGTLLNELIAHGLLMEYSVGGRNYLHIRGFEKHQVINRPSKSSIPPYDDSLRTPTPLPDNSLTTPGALIEGREGKGREGSKSSTLGPSNGRFKPPTFDEVKDYCATRKNQVDALKFHAHYSANGWRVGKNPMRNWKAAVVTWERGNL